MSDGETSALVTQGDRDAAARWVAPNYPGKHASGFADDIANGKADRGALVQAFARHRLTSTPQAASAIPFLTAIHERTPTGAWIAVQHHPDGDWSVAEHPLPWLPGGQVARSPETRQAASAEVREAIARIIDPDAWHNTLPQDGCGGYWMGRRNKALDKADAILALTAQPVTPVTLDDAGAREALARQLTEPHLAQRVMEGGDLNNGVFIRPSEALAAMLAFARSTQQPAQAEVRIPRDQLRAWYTASWATWIKTIADEDGEDDGSPTPQHLLEMEAALAAVPAHAPIGAGEAKEALDLALGYLIQNEPGDSRAVSDEFVAMAAISAGIGGAEHLAIIRRASAELAERNALATTPPGNADADRSGPGDVGDQA